MWDWYGGGEKERTSEVGKGEDRRAWLNSWYGV